MVALHPHCEVPLPKTFWPKSSRRTHRPPSNSWLGSPETTSEATSAWPSITLAIANDYVLCPSSVVGAA
jgi:hypothetical protein